MTDKMRDLKTALDALRGRPDEATCTIIAETGYDEAVIVGAGSALVSLARKLLAVAYAAETGDIEGCDFEREVVDDVEWIATSEVEKVFDETGDVWPVTVYATRDAESVPVLIKRLRG